MIHNVKGTNDIQLQGDGKIANGIGYLFYVNDDHLEVDGAVEAMKDIMDLFANHPNVDPLAFQGALMSAMMQQGKP